MIRNKVTGHGKTRRMNGLGMATLVLALAAMSFINTPARAVEHSLLGIPIYSPAKTVLQKFGNPTRVLPGAPTNAPLTAGAATGAYPGAPGAGGIGPLPPMAMGGPPRGFGGPPMMGGAPGSMPGEFAPPGMGFAPGGMPFGRPPGMTGPNMPTGGAQTPDQAGELAYQNKEATYIYDKPNGLTYAFLLSPSGRVIQITVAGYKDAARTSRGIALGSTYSAVLSKYGFPEQQAVEGDTVFLSYASRAHVAFQLIHNKVVSIMVAYRD